MAIPGEKYLRQIAYASARLFHSNGHLRTLTLARAIHDGVLRNFLAGSTPTACRALPNVQSAPAMPAPQEQSCRGPDDHQRNQLLPIHGRKITSKRIGATNDLDFGGGFFLLCAQQKTEAAVNCQFARDG
jgi:hypothetical protein